MNLESQLYIQSLYDREGSKRNSINLQENQLLFNNLAYNVSKKRSSLISYTDKSFMASGCYNNYPYVNDNVNVNANSNFKDKNNKHSSLSNEYLMLKSDPNNFNNSNNFNAASNIHNLINAGNFINIPVVNNNAVPFFHRNSLFDSIYTANNNNNNNHVINNNKKSDTEINFYNITNINNNPCINNYKKNFNTNLKHNNNLKETINNAANNNNNNNNMTYSNTVDFLKLDTDNDSNSTVSLDSKSVERKQSNANFIKNHNKSTNDCFNDNNQNNNPNNIVSDILISLTQFTNNTNKIFDIEKVSKNKTNTYRYNNHNNTKIIKDKYSNMCLLKRKRSKESNHVSLGISNNNQNIINNSNINDFTLNSISSNNSNLNLSKTSKDMSKSNSKKDHKRALNRLAAKKCRHKKKMYYRSLEIQNKYLKSKLECRNYLEELSNMLLFENNNTAAAAAAASSNKQSCDISNINNEISHLSDGNNYNKRTNSLTLKYRKLSSISNLDKLKNLKDIPKDDLIERSVCVLITLLLPEILKIGNFYNKCFKIDTLKAYLEQLKSSIINSSNEFQTASIVNDKIKKVSFNLERDLESVNKCISIINNSKDIKTSRKKTSLIL